MLNEEKYSLKTDTQKDMANWNSRLMTG